MDLRAELTACVEGSRLYTDSELESLLQRLPPFAEALETSFKNSFAHVVFAVFDRSPGQTCLRAFRERLS